MSKLSRLCIAASLIAVLCLPCFTGSAAAADDGTVQAMRFANGAFTSTLNAPSSATKSWLRAHFWRMTAWSPYFDSRTSWYPNAWFYKDAYAIYDNSSLASEHPEWIFKDVSGNDLYIPFECSSGSCPEYAGNIANSGFRQWWIETAKATLANGYKGIFVDDVNMEFRVSNGSEQPVAPIDPATGTPMTYEAWRKYMAQFMEQIRTAFPGVEVIHNAIWFSDSPAGIEDPFIQRQIDASNALFLERGINDQALTGGSGQWSLDTFLSYAEAVNARGRSVIFGNSSTTPQGEAYDLAGYFLISDGSDGIDVGESGPTRWWPGWEVQLGEAEGPRYQWNGLWRRDFSGGMVLLNPPGEPAVTIEISPMLNTEGEVVTSVTLPASSGAILRPVPPPTIEPPPVGAPLGGASGASGTLAFAAGAPSLVPSGSPAPTKTVIASIHVRRRHLLRIAGGVLRATRGTVRIEVQARRGGAWRTIAVGAARLSRTGAFRGTLALKESARFRLRAIYSGAPGFAPSRSLFHVVPRAATPKG
jgi:Hypothetical glycosyl hydrolase family 15